MSDPRFPIGKFSFESPLNQEQRQKFIQDIEETPAALRVAVQGLSPQQIETPYRDGGWTVRQVTHHVSDSHMNGYIRFKLALTEDAPTIKPYMEDRWAKLADVESAPLEVSLTLLDSLHNRWVRLLRSLESEDWKRTFNHPELGIMPLDKNLALYSWHGRHHVAHVTDLRKKMGWLSS
jgi:DinB superfamily